MEKPQNDREGLKQQLENAERNVTANIERLTKSIENDKGSISEETTQKFAKKVSCVNFYLIIRYYRYYIDVILHRQSLQ